MESNQGMIHHHIVTTTTSQTKILYEFGSLINSQCLVVIVVVVAILRLHIQQSWILQTRSVIGCECSDFVGGTNKALLKNNTNNRLTHASCSSTIGRCNSSIRTVPKGLRSTLK